MPDEFTRAAKQAARDLRRMPADLRRELRTVVSDDVATYLLARMEARAQYVQRRFTFKVRKGDEPQVSIGGGRSITSGGATGRDLVYGLEFGGSTRKGTYPRTSPRGNRHTVRRAVTRQFPRPPRHPFIYPTVRAEYGEVSDRWVSALDPLLTRWEQGG